MRNIKTEYKIYNKIFHVSFKIKSHMMHLHKKKKHTYQNIAFSQHQVSAPVKILKADVPSMSSYLPLGHVGGFYCGVEFLCINTHGHSLKSFSSDILSK